LAPSLIDSNPSVKPHNVIFLGLTLFQPSVQNAKAFYRKKLRRRIAQRLQMGSVANVHTLLYHWRKDKRKN
jgi:hypothetical protein